MIGGRVMTKDNIIYHNDEKIEEIVFHSPKIDRIKSGEITGYASIDKPWLKYYEKDADKREVPNISLYEALIQNNQDYLDNIAFILSDRNDEIITYGEFIDEIHKMVKGFLALGLKAGDEIVTTYKNSVEGAALTFAKSKLGLKVHYIDPTNSPAEKKRMLSETKADYYFVAEEFLDTATLAVENTRIQKAIIMPALTSNKTETDLTKLPNSESYMSYQDFIKAGEKEELPQENYHYAKDEVSTIMYTGGSTGPSKGVMLTDFNFISKYYRQVWSNWKWARGKRNLSALPGIIAFGASDSIISPILAGEENVVVNCLNIPAFPQYILQYKPNHASCSPIHMEFLVNSKEIDENTDLSYLEMMPCGGDGMTKDADIKTRDFLEQHNAKDAFAQGCGFTETVGAFCYGLGVENLPGYMGIPLAGNVSAVFNPETGEELQYGNIGEWAVLSDTTMQGYFASASPKTAGALKKHADGQIWLHPGDMVHMNENGQIAMHDRTSRTFNYLGMKVYPSALEVFLSKHPAVKKCIISGIKSPFAPKIAVTDQKIPIVNIAINEEYKGQEKQVIKELEQILAENAQTYIEVLAYIFRDNLPYTHRGKINYQQLIEEGYSKSEDRKVFVRKMKPQNN